VKKVQLNVRSNFLNGFLTTKNGTKDLNCKKMGLTMLFQFTVKHPVMERENAGSKYNRNGQLVGDEEVLEHCAFWD
jgi:hypothetical protein